MPASNSGYKHLYLDGARASAWRFSPLGPEHPLLDAGSFVDDATGQAQRNHAIVTQLPDPSIRIPRPTGCFTCSRTAASANATCNHDDLVVGEARPWRLPIALRDEELDSFEPLLALGIVAITHADEAITVLSSTALATVYPSGAAIGAAVERPRDRATAHAQRRATFLRRDLVHRVAVRREHHAVTLARRLP